MTENFVTLDIKTYTALLAEIATMRQQVAEQTRYRTAAETAHKQCKAQIRLFMEHASAAVAIFDCNMRYLLASRRWYQDYGIGEKNIIGRSHYEVFPEIGDTWKVIHQKCLAGAIEQCDEQAFPREDGTLDWLKWEMRPWYDAQGEIGGIIMLSEVITAKKKLAELVEQVEQITAQLQEKTLEQQGMLAAFPDLVFRMASDSTILDYKAGKLYAQLELLSEVFLGQKMVELVPLLAEETQQAIAFVLETQSIVSMEYFLPMFNREEYYEARFLPFDAQQVMLSLRNVTEWKQFELQLRQNTKDY